MSTPLGAREQRRTLAAMCLALMTVIASVGALNVALRDIAVDLEADGSQMLWIVNAYTLVLAAFLLPIGEIADRIGRRRILLSGLTLFAVAGAASALATDPISLIALRSISGFAAAMIMPVTLAVITSSFPAEARGRAVGVWAGFAGAGGVFGMFTSAVAVELAPWRWLFLPLVLLAVAAAATSMAVLPRDDAGATAPTQDSEARAPAGRMRGFDSLGGLLVIVGIGGVVLAVQEGPERGWTDALTVSALAVGMICTALFASWQVRIARGHDGGDPRRPIIDVRVFSHRGLAAGSCALLICFALVFGWFLAILQLLQNVLGYSAIAATLGLMPTAAAMMIFSPLAPMLADRYGLGLVLGAGCLLMTEGFLLLALAYDQPDYITGLLPGLVCVGLGTGLAMAPATTAITSALPQEKQGVASALNDTVRELGAALGIALIGAVLTAGYHASITTTAETLPAELARPVEDGIGTAMAAAASLGPDGAPIAAAAEEAFLSGWLSAMLTASAVAIAGALAVLVLAGRRNAARRAVAATEPTAASPEPTAAPAPYEAPTPVPARGAGSLISAGAPVARSAAHRQPAAAVPTGAESERRRCSQCG